MDTPLKFLTVFGLGAIELWAAIPAGLALQLHPLSVGITAAIGAILGVLAIVSLGSRMHAWWVKRHRGKDEKDNRQGFIYQIWYRYGEIGFGLLAPLLIGAPLGVALGITLGIPARRLIVWLNLGIIIWTAAFTIAGELGLAGIRKLMH